MKNGPKELRPGRWGWRYYWRGEKLHIGRNKSGQILEGPKMAMEAWIQFSRESGEKGFDPTEWTKAKPYLLKNAFQTFQQAKQCGDEWRYARGRLFDNHILPELGNMDIREIKTLVVNNFHGELIKKGLSPKTIKNLMALLHSILSFHGIVQRFPTIQVQDKPIKWLTEQQQDMIMQYLNEADKPIFRFLQITGCREGEACALMRDDIDWGRGLVTVQRSMGHRRRIIPYTKNKRIKEIPLSIFDPEIFKPKEATPFVFSKGGQPYRPQQLWRLWGPANRKAHEEHGVPLVHVKNAFRHSLASQMINQGESIQVVSKMLGHSSTKITEQVYANIAPETVWKNRWKITPIRKVEGEK